MTAHPSLFVVGASRSRAAGFSLVEIMVALALSLLLLAGVIAIFMSSRASYETTNKFSRIQESGRFALDQILRDIRAAGYVGCARAPTYLSSSVKVTAPQWDFLAGAVSGFQATGADTWSPSISGLSITNAVSGSDVLLLRGPKREADPIRLTATMSASTEPLTVAAGATGIKVGDIALAYSCEGQAYFQVTAFGGGEIEHAESGSPGNVTDDLQYSFRENAEVVPVATTLYYVKPSAADGTMNSLYRRTALNAEEELVEGVEQMQLQFGVDTNGDSVVDDYVDASSITDWGTVFSVSVALLVRSLDQYGNDLDKRDYQLLDVTVSAPNDRRLREVFAGTANLRNRVPVN